MGYVSFREGSCEYPLLLLPKTLRIRIIEPLRAVHQRDFSAAPIFSLVLLQDPEKRPTKMPKHHFLP